MEQNFTLKKLIVLIALITTALIGTIILYTVLFAIAPVWIQTTNGKLTIQALQTIIVFGLTPIIGISLIEKENPIKVINFNPLKTNRGLIVLLFAIVCIPGISWLAEINGTMKLPSFLSGWENWMKEMEESSRLLTEEFINTDSPYRLIVNIIIIAMLPAVCEEMMFRGWLQRVLTKSTNYHTAIWVSAFIFSAIHLQFYGFIPRMIIGAGLGYIYYYTGTLWGPIIVHFINNAIAVITGYLAYNKITDINFDAIGTGDMWPIAIGSITIASILIVKLNNMNKKAHI